jgi:hypothetical protein
VTVIASVVSGRRSPLVKWIASRSADGEIRLWDMAGKCRCSLRRRSRCTPASAPVGAGAGRPSDNAWYFASDEKPFLLTVACKPFRYQVLAAEAGRWSPIHDLIVNYKEISQQLCGHRAGSVPKSRPKFEELTLGRSAATFAVTPAPSTAMISLWVFNEDAGARHLAASGCSGVTTSAD